MGCAGIAFAKPSGSDALSLGNATFCIRATFGPLDARSGEAPGPVRFCCTTNREDKTRCVLPMGSSQHKCNHKHSAMLNQRISDLVTRTSPQSQLGARASGPARRGVVQARDRAEARCVFAQGDRQGHGLVARSLLAHSCWRKGSHPRHWETLLALVEAENEAPRRT